MMRKPICRGLRIGVAVIAWGTTVAFVEAGAENEIGHATRQLEERIELQLELMERFGAPVVPCDPTPARSHEEPIESWELVDV